MRKLTLLSGALLVMVLALAGGIATPEPAWAFCYCASYNDTTTLMNWGMGADCSAARSDLLAHVNEEARVSCGGFTQTCLGELVITAQCWFNTDIGQWQEDGYRYYSCKTCEPISQ